MTIELSKRLSERLDSNMAEYREFLKAHGEKSAAGMHRETAAMETAYHEMTARTDFGDIDAVFLLRFANPLAVAAHRWLPHMDGGKDFGDVLHTLLHDRSATGQYPLMPDANGGASPRNEQGDCFHAGLAKEIVAWTGVITSVTEMILDIVAEYFGLPPGEDE